MSGSVTARDAAAGGPTRDGAAGTAPVPHAAWLPPEAFRALGARRVLVHGDGPLVDTVFDEVVRACAGHGGWAGRTGVGAGSGSSADGPSAGGPSAGGSSAGCPVDLVLAVRGADPLPSAVPAGATATPVGDAGPLGDEGFLCSRVDGVTVVLADAPAGLLYGLFHLVRAGEAAFTGDRPTRAHRPTLRRRMLDHWDNVAVHPGSGQVERGYAGGSIFWRDGGPRGDRDRLRAYGRLLASTGVNAISVNNVNVGVTEARLLTDRLDDVAEIADLLRPYGVRVHLSVTFAAPVVLGGLPTADPLDDEVRQWWHDTTRRVFARIPDFGGYVVKADSEGNPARSPTGGTTPTARTCSPPRSPRTGEWCTGGRSSTTTGRTGGTAAPTGPAPRTTTSLRWTAGSPTTWSSR